MAFLTVGGPYPSIAQNKKAAISWSISASCVHCFPFAVIKYHDQGKFTEGRACLDSGFQRDKSQSWQEAWWQEAGIAARNWMLRADIFKCNRESVPSDALPPARLNPKQYHQLGTKCSKAQDLGGHFLFKLPYHFVVLELATQPEDCGTSPL